MSGGQAIENAANKATDPKKFSYEPTLTKKRNCQFSFSGLCTTTLKYIDRQEKEFNINGNALIPDVYNLCAAVQLALIKHICLRTQRAMEFISNTNVISQERRTLVSNSTSYVSHRNLSYSHPTHLTIGNIRRRGMQQLVSKRFRDRLFAEGF